MKCNGFDVREHGSGYQVTVAYFVGREEGGITELLNELTGMCDDMAMSMVPADAGPRGSGTEAPAEDKPKGRQGRKKAEAPQDSESPTAATASAATSGSPRGGRQRKAAAAADTGAAEKTSLNGDISDADLSKAASLAGQAGGAEEVVAVLEEFGVTLVSELPQENREEFLGIMAEIVKEAKGG